MLLSPLILALAVTPGIQETTSQYFILPNGKGESLALISVKAVEDRGQRILERHLVWRGRSLECLQTESTGPSGFKFVHRELPLDRRGGRTWLAEMRSGDTVLHLESHCNGAPSPTEVRLTSRPVGVMGLTQILSAGAQPLDRVWLLQPNAASLTGIHIQAFDPHQHPALTSAAREASRAAGIDSSEFRLTGFDWVTDGGRVLRRQVFSGRELLLFQGEGRETWARRVGAQQASQWMSKWAPRGQARTGLVMGGSVRNASRGMGRGAGNSPGPK